jgi:uncharacterized membrane protein YciS (DUF1049 family)
MTTDGSGTTGISANQEKLPSNGDKTDHKKNIDEFAQSELNKAQESNKIEERTGTEEAAEQAIKNAETERKNAQLKYQALLARRSAFLTFAIPYLIVSMVLLAGNELVIFNLLTGRSELQINSPFVRVGTLWLLAGTALGAIFYFSVQTKIHGAKFLLKQADEDLAIIRMSTRNSRLTYYREKLSRLTAITAKLLFFDEKEYNTAECLRSKAGQALDAVIANPTYSGLSDVETNLTALEEMVNREERDQKEQRYWQYAALVVMFLYIAGLVTCVVVFKAASSTTETPIFRVPLAIVLWGAAGSLAAILYRFYSEQGRIQFSSEFRWLVARPIIGIIMGAVVFLSLKSGLILLGQAELTEGAVQASRIEVYSVIAFLAGFSDKFYLGVIDLLVARTVKTEEVKPNVITTESQRIPGPHQEGDSQ